MDPPDAPAAAAAPAHGPAHGLDRLRPLPEDGAEPGGWRGRRSAAGTLERRRSLQPGRGLPEESAGYAGQLRSLRSRRTTVVAFREEAEQEGDDVGESVGFRQLRSGRRSVMPLREEPEEEDPSAFHTLRSGRRLSVLPPREPPRAASEDVFTAERYPLRSGRRSMLPQSGRLATSRPAVDLTETEPRPAATRRRSMQLHRELSDEEYSRALATLRSLRDALPTPLSTPLRDTKNPSGSPADDGAVFASPLPPPPLPAGPRDRRSVRLSMVPLADCAAPTPRRRSVLPVGFSPAPKFRRSSVYVSSDAAEAAAEVSVAAGEAADVSLSYEDPAGRVLELCGLQQPANFVQYCRRSVACGNMGSRHAVFSR